MNLRKEVSIKAILPQDKYKWVCIDCGSEDVEEQVWTSINDYIIINRQTYARVGSLIDENDIYYCNECNSECMVVNREDYLEEKE